MTPEDGAPWKYEGLIKRVVDEVRPYTVVPFHGLACTIAQTIEAVESDIPGVIVECGVFKGGASFAMLLAQRYYFGEIRRPVFMYDSFEGMSEPVAEDGQHARWWKDRSKTSSVDPDGVNYCVASIEEVTANAALLDLTDNIYIHKGWYHETLINCAKPDAISVLRIDADWYEACSLVYDQMAPLVSVGGRIIIDDYNAWEGCRLATHEYLAINKLPWIIRSVPGDNGAWMIKEKDTW